MYDVPNAQCVRPLSAAEMEARTIMGFNSSCTLSLPISPFVTLYMQMSQKHSLQLLSILNHFKTTLFTRINSQSALMLTSA